MYIVLHTKIGYWLSVFPSKKIIFMFHVPVFHVPLTEQQKCEHWIEQRIEHRTPYTVYTQRWDIFRLIVRRQIVDITSYSVKKIEMKCQIYAKDRTARSWEHRIVAHVRMNGTAV
jgi:hypothetical protein